MKIVNNIVSNLFMWVLAVAMLIILSPLLIVIAITIVAVDGTPIIYIQKRVGKNGKKFDLIKFRTMKNGSVSNDKLKSLNEVDGPVFKIKNDPRFFGWGKFLSHTGMDELPQFINIVKGEMSLIGPRPLPVDEAKKIDKKYKARENVMPGIISPWVLEGYHKLSFDEWMTSDLKYVKKKNFVYDLWLFFKSAVYMVDILVSESILLKRK